jgi:hypothetical protein
VYKTFDQQLSNAGVDWLCDGPVNPEEGLHEHPQGEGGRKHDRKTPQKEAAEVSAAAWCTTHVSLL